MAVMYLNHFGLHQAPFRITPHTEFFFSGSRRGSTLEALIYAITHDEGIVKVSGEVGAGKTMLCRMLAERLPKNFETVYLSNPLLEREEILYALAEELKIDMPQARPHSLLRTLEDELLDIHTSSRRQVVVLVDEAHALSAETLEEIRLLSNLEVGQHKLIHIVLFGQSELDKRLMEPGMRQLKERITHNFALEPLCRDGVANYLMFRMRIAGYNNGLDVFTNNAISLISQASEGLTRRINILADKALLSAASENKRQVDQKHVKEAIVDAQFNTMHTHTPLRNLWALGAFGVALGAALISVIYVSIHRFPSVKKTSPAEIATTPIEAETRAAGKPSTLPEATTPLKAIPASAPALPEAAAQLTAEILPSDFSERIQATDEWLRSVPDTHFIIQLMTTDARNQSAAEAFVEKISAQLDAEKIRIYRSKLSGRDRIGVIYGDYATEAEAHAELQKINKMRLGTSPYIRSVRRLR